MALSTGEKIAVIGGIAGAAVVIGAAVAMAKKPTVPAPAIAITVTPTSLPSSGGTITVKGTVQCVGCTSFAGVPTSQFMHLLVNGNIVDTFSIAELMSGISYDIPANTGKTVEKLSIVVSEVSLKSNVVTVTVAGVS
jgi:hypothetical protein